MYKKIVTRTITFSWYNILFKWVSHLHRPISQKYYYWRDLLNYITEQIIREERKDSQKKNKSQQFLCLNLLHNSKNTSYKNVLSIVHEAKVCFLKFIIIDECNRFYYPCHSIVQSYNPSIPLLPSSFISYFRDVFFFSLFAVFIFVVFLIDFTELTEFCHTFFFYVI